MSGNNELEKLFEKFEVKFAEKIDSIAVKIKSDIEILFEQKLQILNKEVDELKKMVEGQNDKINELVQRNLDIDIESRKKNLLLFNVPENDRKDINETVLETINTNGDLNIVGSDIDVTYRLGKINNNNQKCRPIMVKFNSRKIRDKVLAKIPSYIKNRIYVYEDLPKQISEFRKKVYPLVKKLRADGKRVYYNLKEFKVNGIIWSLQEVNAALEDIKAGTTNANKRARSPDTLEGQSANKPTGAVKKFLYGGLLTAQPSTSV